MTTTATAPAAPAQTVVSESRFSYTPPPAAPQSEHEEFSQSLKDVISEIEGEYASKPPVDLEEPATEETQETAPEAEVPATPVSEDDPAVTRGMDRLVQREVALQAREAKLQAQESENTTLRQEITTLRSRMPAADLQEKLSHSPSEAIKALGHDPATVVRLLIAEQLTSEGKELPPALKEFVGQASLKREQASQRAEVESLKAQLAERTRLEHATAYFNTIAQGAHEYVTKTVSASKNLPTLAGIAKANPERAHREIMEEITADAQRRTATDPTGEPLTYDQAAKNVEARLSDWKALLVQTPTGTTQTPSGAASKTPPATVKPPTKPLKPWEAAGNDIYKQGIAEAEREFFRLEQARLTRR